MSVCLRFFQTLNQQLSCRFLSGTLTFGCVKCFSPLYQHIIRIIARPLQSNLVSVMSSIPMDSGKKFFELLLGLKCRFYSIKTFPSSFDNVLSTIPTIARFSYHLYFPQQVPKQLPC